MRRIKLTIILLMITLTLLTMVNPFLYKETLAKVTQEKIIDTTNVIDKNHNHDIVYTQTLTLKILNTKQSGEFIQINNHYSKSGAFDEAYKRGDVVFIHGNDITGVKRDTMLMAMTTVFITLLLLIGDKHGLMSVISLMINIIISLNVFNFYLNHPHIPLLLIAMFSIIISTILTLLIVSGWNKKTLIAIMSTLIGTFMTLIITLIVINLTNGEGIKYETMEFLTIPPRKVFLTAILFGSLGAVMDIAITISSALYEIKLQNHSISKKHLIKSGFEIGHDIMGPMTNIIFFAYLSGSIPYIILYLRNYSPIVHSFNVHWSIEICRAVTGGIGIVLTIPVTILICALMLRGEQTS